MELSLKTAVDFNAEAQRCRVTQRKVKFCGEMENTRIFLTERSFTNRVSLVWCCKNENNFQKT